MTDLAERVTKLERRMNDIEPLARGASKDVGDVQALQRAHTKSIEALQETMVERFAKVELKMRDGFRQTNENFAAVEQKLGVLKVGMDHITNLLTPKASDES
jgi:hypothetical protein